MPESCIQERTIGEIRATLQYFQAAETRRELREERMAVAMEKVAAQGETLNSHAENLARHEKALVEAFNRIRVLEVSPETAKDRKFLGRLFESKAGPYLLGALVAGCLVGLTTNYSAVGKIIGNIFEIGG